MMGPCQCVTSDCSGGRRPLAARRATCQSEVQGAGRGAATAALPLRRHRRAWPGPAPCELRRACGV